MGRKVLGFSGPTARYHRSLGKIPRTREPPQVHGSGKIGRLSRIPPWREETAGGNACFT